MANPQLNIGNLDFDDIKQSLKDYLSEQTIFKDYDFEGSALSTMLDVLSYNTLYYAFYSNMIANEMFLDTAQKLSSVISLAKPLGYVVPGARSAVATFQVIAGGAGTVIGKYSRFTGKDETGRSFNFYTIQEHQTDSSGNVEFDIYQGSKLFRNVEVTLSEDRTRAFISRTDIDIRTLEVTVEEPGESATEWILSSSTNDQINSESKVYFLDRTDAGFYIVFGGNYSDGINTNAGRPVPENSIVRVSYLTSSGELGNGVGNFTTDVIGGTQRTVFPSSGGALEPNIDAVKFFAPKWFAAQDRVVTKNDAIAALSRDFISEETPDANYRINVWGGEEHDPPYYGRLFVSILNEDPNAGPDPDGAEIISAIQTLKDKCVVTVLPEHFDASEADFNVNITGSFDPTQTNKTQSQLESEVASALRTNLGGQRAFNKVVKQNSIISIAESVSPAITVEASNITSVVKKNFEASEGKRFFYLKNAIKRQVTTIPNRSIRTTETTGYNGITNLQIVDFPQATDSKGWAPLYLAVRSNSNVFTYISENGQNVVAGRVNYSRGIVEVNEGMLIQPFTMTIIPDTVGLVAKQELVLKPTFTVTLRAN